jgi:hypothetical protein
MPCVSAPVPGGQGAVGKTNDGPQNQNQGCRFNGAGSLFIDPGSPWQNAWIESINGRLRDELPNSWRFDSLREAPSIAQRPRNTTRGRPAGGADVAVFFVPGGPPPPAVVGHDGQ